MDKTNLLRSLAKAYAPRKLWAGAPRETKLMLEGVLLRHMLQGNPGPELQEVSKYSELN